MEYASTSPTVPYLSLRVGLVVLADPRHRRRRSLLNMADGGDIDNDFCFGGTNLARRGIRELPVTVVFKFYSTT